MPRSCACTVGLRSGFVSTGAAAAALAAPAGADAAGGCCCVAGWVTGAGAPAGGGLLERQEAPHRTTASSESLRIMDSPREDHSGKHTDHRPGAVGLREGARRTNRAA